MSSEARPVTGYPGQYPHRRVTTTTTTTLSVQTVVRDALNGSPQFVRKEGVQQNSQSNVTGAFNGNQQSVRRQDERTQQNSQSIATGALNGSPQSVRRQDERAQQNSQSINGSQQSVRREGVQQNSPSNATTIARPIESSSSLKKSLTNMNNFVPAGIKNEYSIFVPKDFHYYRMGKQDIYCLPENMQGYIFSSVTVETFPKQFFVKRGWPSELFRTDPPSVIRSQKRFALRQVFKRLGIVLSEDSSRFTYDDNIDAQGRQGRTIEGRIATLGQTIHIIKITYTPGSDLFWQVEVILRSFSPSGAPSHEQLFPKETFTESKKN